jgi:hypothetical protein
MRASRGSAGGVRGGGSARGGSPEPSATPFSTWHAVEVCQVIVGLVCPLGRLVCLYSRSLLLPSWSLFSLIGLNFVLGGSRLHL